MVVLEAAACINRKEVKEAEILTVYAVRGKRVYKWSLEWKWKQYMSVLKIRDEVIVLWW